MKKQTKLLISITIILLVIYTGNFLYQQFTTTYGLWRINWGLDVPKPSKMNIVYERYGVGDGEAYVICEYDDRGVMKVKKSNQWKKVDTEAYNMLTLKISQFKKNISEMYLNKQDHYLKLFLDHPIDFNEDSLYYFRAKKSGSYFISIFNEEKRKIYVIEWAM